MNKREFFVGLGGFLLTASGAAGCTVSADNDLSLLPTRISSSGDTGVGEVHTLDSKETIINTSEGKVTVIYSSPTPGLMLAPTPGEKKPIVTPTVTSTPGKSIKRP